MKLRTPILFLVLACTCSWPAVLGFLFEEFGEIHPEDPYLLENDTLILTCHLTGYGGGLDSAFMFFEYKMNGLNHDFIAIPEEYQEIVDDTTIRMTWPMIQTESSGYFYCRINESSIGGNERRTIAQTEVIITTPPLPITDVSCISDNNYDMTCNWCDQVEPGVAYELQWTVSSIMYGDCPIPTYHETHVLCGCKFCQDTTQEGECEGENQTYFPPTTCHLNITSKKVNRFQVSSVVSVNTSFTVIVKPHPPQTLVVSNIASRSATVGWAPPPELGFFPLEYNVTYWSSRAESQPQTVTTKNMTVELDDLHPFDDYTVHVMARPDPDGVYTSEPAKATFKTEQDAPSAAPAMAKGSFKPVKNSDQNKRSLYVYWQEIPEEDRNGEIRHYVVRARDLSDDTEETFEEVIPTKFHKIIDLREDRAYNISVSAHTEAGEGPRAWLHVPHLSEVVPQPAHLDGVISDTSILFTIVPPEGVEVTDYTLFWCQSISSNQRCEGPAHSLTLDGDVQQYIMDGYVTDNVYSLAVNSAESTSGLAQQWLCLYDHGGDPGPVEFEFIPDQPERALSIRWDHLECGTKVRGKVEVYNIYINASTANISETVFSSPVVTGQLEYSYTIEDLKPYTTYYIEMEACTQGTCGEMTPVVQKTVESAPEDAPSNCKARVINSSTVKVTWEPPSLQNGVISKYHIFGNTSGHSVSEEVAGDMHVAVVYGLRGYTNYSIHILAENSAGFSPVSQSSFVLTPMRAPAPVRFDAEVFSNDTIFVSWTMPDPANGPISYYNATFTRNEDGKPSEQTKTVNSTAIFVTTDCSRGAQHVNVSVIAVNVDASGKQHPSPSGEVKSVETCAGKAEPPLALIVSFAVLGPLLLIGLAGFYFLWKKCCSHKHINIKLPDDIDSTITASCDKVDPYAEIEEGLHTNSSKNDDCSNTENSSKTENPVSDSDSGLSSGSSRDGSVSSKSSGLASNSDEKSNPFSSGESQDIETYTKVAKNGTSSGGLAADQKPDEMELEEVAIKMTRNSGRRDSSESKELTELTQNNSADGSELTQDNSVEGPSCRVSQRQDSCKSDIDNYTKGTEVVIPPQDIFAPGRRFNVSPSEDRFVESPEPQDPKNHVELSTTASLDPPMLVLDLSMLSLDQDSEPASEEDDIDDDQSSGDNPENVDGGIYRQGSEEMRHQEVYVPDGPAAPIIRNEATC